MSFPDVPPHHWAYDAVERLAKDGIIEGFPDGSFRGNVAVTRYELAVVLDRLRRPSPPASLLQTIITDLFGPPFRSGGTTDSGYGPPWGAHEAVLDVPVGIDWRTGARPGWWDDPGNRTHITAWGHIHTPVTGVGASRNWRIHIRRHRVYIFSQGTWTKLIESQGVEWEGGWYFTPGRWAGRGQWRSEAEGFSVKCPDDPTWKTLHWWPKGLRVPLPARPFIVLSYGQMRLIPDIDSSVDLASARILGGVGADYHYAPGVAETPPIPGIAISRSKFITPDWRVFTQMAFPVPKPPKNDPSYDYVGPFSSLTLPSEVLT